MEFERNQITRKGVFVRNKKVAPVPPPRASVETENEINLNKSMTTQEPPAVEDDSLDLLSRLEKQINRIEFDTKTAPPDDEKPSFSPIFKKPVHYTGMETLLNTGVSDVATENGIGYFEKDPDEELRLRENFKRNQDGRQSVNGPTEKWTPPVKAAKPVARTASDSKNMKELVMTKHAAAARETEHRMNNKYTINPQSAASDSKGVKAGSSSSSGHSADSNNKEMGAGVRKALDLREWHSAIKVKM